MEKRSVSAPNVDVEREDTDDAEEMYGDVMTPNKHNNYDEASFDCEGVMATQTMTPFDHGSTVGDV